MPNLGRRSGPSKGWIGLQLQLIARSTTITDRSAGLPQTAIPSLDISSLSDQPVLVFFQIFLEFHGCHGGPYSWRPASIAFEPNSRLSRVASTTGGQRSVRLICWHFSPMVRIASFRALNLVSGFSRVAVLLSPVILSQRLGLTFVTIGPRRARE
jgi:hypothetical protein